jgi:membrane protein
MGRRKKQPPSPRAKSLAWDLAPLMVLAGAGVALLQKPDAAPARAAQAGRSQEHGRGRHAASPTQIPRRGWMDILLRTRSEFSEDQAPLVSAGITFYTLLALFPGLAAFVSLYGLFADPAEAYRHLKLLSFLLPGDAMSLIGEQMIRLAEGDKGGQSLAFVTGLLLSIWSANGAIKALITGLNIAYEETETRSLVKRTLISLAFTLGFLIFVILTVGLIAARPAVEAFAGREAGLLFDWLSWPALALVLITGVALLYRYGPSRDPVQWKWISLGSLGVVALWLLGSSLFSLYVANFAHYDRTYGSLGAVIGFMMWIYLSTMVILAGAELNSEIEHQTAVDTTTGQPRPMGLRGAKMADTLGAPQQAPWAKSVRRAFSRLERRPAPAIVR